VTPAIIATESVEGDKDGIQSRGKPVGIVKQKKIKLHHEIKMADPTTKFKSSMTLTNLEDELKRLNNLRKETNH